MISSFWEGWSRRTWHLKENDGSVHQHFVSVLIPFRNEEKNLKDLLLSLEGQSYNPSSFEVIFIDDHSTDKSAEIVKQYASTSDLNLTCIASNDHGKKKALVCGLPLAKGNIILQTDADCLPAPLWIQGMIEAFDKDTSIVLGLVKMETGSGFWSKFAALEFMSLQASGAALIMRSNPIMGSAASMGYRRNLLEEINVAEISRASGDDVFLIQKAVEQGKKVKYNSNPSSVVSTTAPSSLGALIDQRSRWGAKTPSYTSMRAKYIAVLVATYALWCVGLLILGLFSAALLQLFVFMVGAKALLDYFFLKSFSHFTKQQGLMKIFPSAALFYPFYILITLIRMLMPIKWSGRVIR